MTTRLLPWLLLFLVLAAWGLREYSRCHPADNASSCCQPTSEGTTAASRPAAKPPLAGSAPAVSPPPPATTRAANEVWRIPFESFVTKDWNTGRLLQLPLLIPGDPKSFARPTHDGGDWSAQAFLVSDDSRSGKSFQIQIRNPVKLRGGGVEWRFFKKTALAPGKRHTATIWAKSEFTGEPDEYADMVLGWAPGSLFDAMIQQYTEYARQTNVKGWTQIALSFVSNKNPDEGDRLLIALAAKSQKLALSAVFDDLVITQDER